MRYILRFFGFVFAAGSVIFVLAAAAGGALLWSYSSDLPDYTQLANHEPWVMTRVHAGDGSLLAEYSEQRRLYMPIQAVPKLVIAGFLSSEDKNFYKHHGVDPEGMARAAEERSKAECARLQDLVKAAAGPERGRVAAWAPPPTSAFGSQIARKTWLLGFFADQPQGGGCPRTAGNGSCSREALPSRGPSTSSGCCSAASGMAPSGAAPKSARCTSGGAAAARATTSSGASSLRGRKAQDSGSAEVAWATALGAPGHGPCFAGLGLRPVGQRPRGPTSPGSTWQR